MALPRVRQRREHAAQVDPVLVADRRIPRFVHRARRGRQVRDSIGLELDRRRAQCRLCAVHALRRVARPRPSFGRDASGHSDRLIVAYDEKLAARIRKSLARAPGITEQQMFGGLAFLMRGNMLVGVHKDALIVRIAPDETDDALRDSNARLFDITGRPMKGWILVDPAGVRGAKLVKWILRARAFVRTLPPK